MQLIRLLALPLLFVFLTNCTGKDIQNKTADDTFATYWQDKVDEPVRVPANIFNDLFPTKEAKPFTQQDLLSISSSTKLGVKKARLIVDNDAAFKTKLDAIRSAQPGEAIRIAYYIFNPDHSSALIYAELLAAAQRGVKVKILADLLTNYLYLDLFRLLSASPNVEIKFFGRPTNLVLRDIKFLSLPCPPAPSTPSPTFCSKAKWKQITEPYSSMDFYGKALLAGMLAKDPTALKIGFLMGQEIDLKTYTEGAAASPEEKKQLLELLELIYRWKVKGEGTAGLKARLAVLMYGKKVTPVMNELFGRLPLSQIGEKSGKDWEHVSDFNHHKLLMIDSRFLQVGGRNIENSYHMAPNPLVHRYVFKDADMTLDLSSGGEGVIQSFEELFSFSPMVISLKELIKLAPNDLVANEKAVDAAYEKCATGKTNRKKFQACMRKTTQTDRDYKNSEQRVADLKESLSKKMREYNEYAAQSRPTEHWNSDGDDFLSKADLKSGTITYIENVPYDRDLPVNKRKRIYGTRHGYEKEDGKYIHYAWSRGLQNACVRAQATGKETRVILHSAYFLPPASLIQDMTKMFDGTWNCNNVRVTILSNSFATTDLNVVNALGQYQMTAFFNAYARAESYFPRGKNQRAKFEYYEYKKFKGADDISLHKKLHVMGDDVFVGSANGDVRSYYMDTNNGLYLQNVPVFAREYSQWVDSLLKNKSVATNRTKDFMGGGKEISSLLLSMHRDDVQNVEEYLAKKGWGKSLDSETKAKIYDKLEATGKLIFDLTRKIMSVRFIEGDHDEQQKKLQEQKRAANQFNRMMQLL